MTKNRETRLFLSALKLVIKANYRAIRSLFFGLKVVKIAKN